MDSKREIHGFDQAIVLLMFALDKVFANRVDGWSRARNGFRVLVLSNRDGLDVKTRIIPVGLPETDWVYCRFYRFCGAWSPIEGHISFDHSAKEIQNFWFKGEDAGRDYADVPIHAIHDSEKLDEILARDRVYTCPTV